MDIILKGITSKILEVSLRDSSDGSGKTALAFGDVTASYCREGGTRTAIVLAAGSVGDAYSSGKWAEVDATNQAGLYQLHLPDAALATGADAVTITLQATDTISYQKRWPLVDVDARDSTAFGMSLVPANVIQVSSDSTAADNLEADYDGTGYNKSNSTVGTVTANTDMRGTDGANTVVPPTAAANADAVWDEERSGHTTSGTYGQNTGDAAMRGTDGANTVAPDPAGTVPVDGSLTVTLADSVTHGGSAAVVHMGRMLLSGIAGNPTVEMRSVDGNNPTIYIKQLFDGTPAIVVTQGSGLIPVTLGTAVEIGSADQTDTPAALRLSGTNTVIVENTIDILDDMTIVGGNVYASLQAIQGADLDDGVAGLKAENFSTFYENAGASTAQTVDDVGGGGGGLDETTLAKYIAILARSDAAMAADLATEIAAINADFDGSGIGDYDPTDDSQEAIADAVSLLSGSTGPGDDQVTITINNTTSGLPEENVEVWISNDSAGANVIAGTLVTDANGEVQFLLTDGATYYLWAQKPGVMSIQGESFVASED